jgi:hypothetical protein
MEALSVDMNCAAIVGWSQTNRFTYWRKAELSRRWISLAFDSWMDCLMVSSRYLRKPQLGGDALASQTQNANQNCFALGVGELDRI